MAHLNERGCISCPTVYVYGTIGAEDLRPFLDEEQTNIVRSAPSNDFPFIVQEYLPSGTTLKQGPVGESTVALISFAPG